MKKAAHDFPSIRAGQKAIEASEDQETALLLNQISLSGSVTQQNGNTDMGTAGLSQSLSQSTTSRSVGLQLMLSLSTWFQAQGIELSRATQAAALRALQMQTAAEVAQAYMSFYYNDNRFIYLSVLLEKLGNVKKDVDSGKIALNPANQGLLVGKINEIQANLTLVELLMETSRADLVKYTGENPVSGTEYWKSLTDPRKYDLTYSGVDWKALDGSFPIPPTVDEAFARSKNAPALVQAQLAEKSAENQWFLTLSSNGPHVLFRFEKSRSDQDATSSTIDSSSFTVNVSYTLGAGTFHSLSSARLLEEAAKLNREAAELQIKNGLAKLYATQTFARKQMVSYDEALKAIVEGLKKTQPQGDENFQEYLTLISGLDGAASQLVDNATKFVMTRIQAHGMMGSLLEELDRPAQ